MMFTINSNQSSSSRKTTVQQLAIQINQIEIPSPQGQLCLNRVPEFPGIRFQYLCSVFYRGAGLARSLQTKGESKIFAIWPRSFSSALVSRRKLTTTQPAFKRWYFNEEKR